MKPFLSAALLASTILLGACATTVGSEPAQSVAASPHEALFAAFAAADEADLKLNPLDALSRGDMRYAEHFGDYDSDAYYSAQKQNAETNIEALHRLDRDALSPTDKIAYDVFAWNQQRTLDSLADDILPLTEVRPVNHYASWQVYYPTIASGQGSAPFATLEDYEENLKRNAEYVAWVDRAIGRMREGLASGVVESRMTIDRTIEQLDAQLAAPIEDSPFYGPVGQFPEDFSAADRERLTAEYRANVGTIFAAYKRLEDFLKQDYQPKARQDVGLWAMKGGDRLYPQLIERYTTLPLDPEEVHQTGLKEVARILDAMRETQKELGFEGTLQEYFTWLRTDPRFKRKTAQEKIDAFNRISKMVDAKAPEYFAHLPKLPLEVRPVEPFREKYAAEGSYNEGSPDGSRPGIFYYSTYDLPARTTPNEITLYMHEAAPGHHFQISLAMENTALPNFIRFGGNTAFVEGWALYAETLGYPMGFYADPAARFGTLNDEMLRALRLVVDTGIHAKGWTREQAIQYMTDNSALGLEDIRAEVERYIAIPGQALAYKTGALTIQRLRAKAEKELGERFDIREFHDQVLNTGALPLPILEQKIDDWIAAKKG
ncbi:DUF885 family protein [Altererythrobacter salegens]|uniref:DUF885 family protein n=1 Tax=Croceibacterium salegens TaxID=1737568 RepID=A0A6I4SXQ6_9SPHN|nr:DUF885 domain-containing protein [Croceibacterium salegens]MXO60129.1 DUF885 family protein [Croceibacterium salegens]